MLRWMAASVIVAGSLVAALVVVLIDEDLGRTPAWLLPAMTGLVAVASAAVVRVRLRSAVVAAGWTEAAIVVCIVVLPSAWVPLCVGCGVLLAKLLARVSPFKAAYNAGKGTLAAGAGLVVAVLVGVAESTAPLSQLWQLVVVAAIVTLTENAIGVPVLALASATSWHRVLLTNWDIKLSSFGGKLSVAILTFWLWEIDVRLVAVAVPVALCLHLLYASRIRSRAEQAAWRRLATTTEELNDTDLAVVLATAVVNAATLFAADEVEVLLRDGPDGPLLVRGNADGVRWSGDPGRAPPRGRDADSITVRLPGDGTDLGEVRLHYAGRVSLTDRERLTLSTFVSALRTAIRNASAYAEVRQLAIRSAHAAMHDPLTGLPNRHRLQEYGESVLGGPDPVALVVIDVDLFREVNETLGHVAGDRLLVEVSRRLAGAAGPADVVARLGGDEFAVLLAGPRTPAATEQRARDLLATLDDPIDLGEMRVRVEASAGTAMADQTLTAEAGGMVELLRRADVAMYQAKRGGGPRIVRYEPDRDTTDVAQLMLGGDLPRAIADREFAVCFQPIVDLATGQMVSAEALARWLHPDRGDLDPRRFLTAVERSGLLPAFAEAVLDQALAAMLRWRAEGVDAPVAVNASPRSLLDAGFPRMVTDRLAAHGVTGSELVIELTESLTPNQVEMIGGVLTELRDAGVRLALDDFGTGYSSLAMLATVPVYELKIDRSFVSAMDTSAEAAAVVHATIELGRSLDLVVVAEGVERADQRQMLWQLGCSAGQGHLFARPMVIDALIDRVRTGPGSGRLCEPIRSSGENVIDLLRPRRGDQVHGR